MEEADATGTPDARSKRPLNVPPAERAHYPRNLIRQAVCELRFPTLFEIDDPRPPAAFWKSIRKSFPLHDVLKDVNVSSTAVAQGSAHQFRSSPPKAGRPPRWTVTLRPTAVSLETTQYGTFEEFDEQLQSVVEAAQPTIESDFFTRVGLRYINVLPCEPNEIDGWLNPAVIGPVASGVFGEIDEHMYQVRGSTDCGGYLFQVYLGEDNNRRHRRFAVDFDFYQEQVAVSDAIPVVRRLHQLEFSLFNWSLGEKALDFMKSQKRP